MTVPLPMLRRRVLLHRLGPTCPPSPPKEFPKSNVLSPSKTLLSNTQDPS